MAPMYGSPNYEFSDEENYWEDDDGEEKPQKLTEMAFWYMIVLIAMLLLWLIMFFCLRIIALRQKTRNAQPRRMYVGAHPRQSLGTPEPTIYVSPSNLPPPPKYEFMAPPSYEEVVGVHYPQFSAQPISQPITNALQGPSQPPSDDNFTSVTVVSEPSVRRTSVSVATA